MPRMEHINVVIGEALASRMAEKGLGTRALAKEACMPPSTLDRKLRGGAGFTVPELVRVSEQLDLDVGDLLRDAVRNTARVA